tara:strand:- start:18280 stop:20211 length:1932 start_codon:yes stop_codon:yes gene_type:complete
MAYALKINYFNSFWLKKAVGNVTEDASSVLASYAYNMPKKTPVATWPGIPWLNEDSNENIPPNNPGHLGFPQYPWGDGLLNGNPDYPNVQRNWFVEEARIKGGYNNTTVDFGVRAYLVDDNNEQQRRINTLIYSGIFNSRTGINDTNVFSVGEDITKSLDPANGSIQKLYAEDTNLLIFQENKVSKALIDKDALYTAEGDMNVTSTNKVIGQIVPYLGEYGISTNPESFAIYSYQKYFADKNRTAILRLSRDGITEISEYGMRDYFRDYLSTIGDSFVPNVLSYAAVTIPSKEADTGSWITFSVSGEDNCGCCGIQIGSVISVADSNLEFQETSVYVVDVTPNGDPEECGILLSNRINPREWGWDSGDTEQDVYDQLANGIKFTYYKKPAIEGGYDIHTKSYVVSMQPLVFEEGCEVEEEYNTLNFDESINGWVSYYSYKPTWMDSLKNVFYSVDDYKIYQHYVGTITSNHGNFYGTYTGSSIEFIFNDNASMVKNFQTVNYEGTNGWQVESFISDPTELDQYPAPIYPPTTPITTTGSWQTLNDRTAVVLSYEEGAYIDPTDGSIERAGFVRKENRYVANLKNFGSNTQSEQVILSEDSFGGGNMSGIKGYYATVILSTDTTTDVGGMKELYAVGTKYVKSS